MVGAHLDSWHTSDGATDNADGVATVIEAFRILKTLGIEPRRTLRLALWGGEEQGLLGSRAWVTQHLAGPEKQAERDQLSVYFNLDNGYPPISGFYMEGNEAFRPIMEAWLKPLAELGAATASPEDIGATDHLSFKASAFPGSRPSRTTPTTTSAPTTPTWTPPTRAAGGAEAGVGGDGDGALPGGDARPEGPAVSLPSPQPLMPWRSSSATTSPRLAA